MAEIDPQLKQILTALKLNPELADKKVTLNNLKETIDLVTQAQRERVATRANADVKAYAKLNAVFEAALKTDKLTWNRLFEGLSSAKIDLDGNLFKPSTPSESLAGIFAGYVNDNPNHSISKSFQVQITGDTSIPISPNVTPRQELKDFLTKLAEVQKLKEPSADVLATLSNKNILGVEIRQLFDGVLAANGATIPQRQAFMDKHPIPSMTWNQLFDPSKQMPDFGLQQLKGKDGSVLSLGDALTKTILMTDPSDSKDMPAQAVRNFITKGIHGEALIPELGGGKKPDGRAPWAPPPPPAKKVDPIHFEAILPEGVIKTAILSHGEPPLYIADAAKPNDERAI